MEIQELVEFERISAHSHIKGLGLKGLKALKIADGMVGQEKAREAAGIVVRLIKEGKFAGRAILLVGPPGTGKTSIAIAIAKELGKDVPFVQLAASEIFSTEMKKTEFLTQTLRKAIGVRIHELRKVYEGVVTSLEIKTKSHPYNPYQQVPTGAVITLKTKDETKKLTTDQSFAMQFIQKNIEEGDIVQIDRDGGHVTKLGKCKDYVKDEEELSSETLLEMPKGNIFKNKEFTYTVSLHQMDLINSRQGDIFSLFFGQKSEIDNELRKEIDSQVKEMVQSGKAEILPGVVFIDECSLLDIESFAFLNRAMEQDLAPIIIFATNRGITTIRGTDIKAPHGIPIDLLDRLLIITTEQYDEEDIKNILKIRAKSERITIDDDALAYLTKIGTETTLRHAIQLLAPAREIAKEEGKEKILKEHIEKAKNLFVDLKESIARMKKYESLMLE